MKNFIRLCLFYIALCMLFPQNSSSQITTWNHQVFKIDTLAQGFNFPWEITYGPDDSLWVTESHGYIISKVHARNGGKRTLKNLNSLKDFTSPTIWPQGGLMGLALHPQLLTGKPYVYVALVYHENDATDGAAPLDNSQCSGGSGSHACYFKTEILRYTYNTTTKQLNNTPDVIINSLNGSNDHNSGRLTIDPVNFKLFYTIGDMGAGQFNNQNRPHNGQNTNILEGKILRFNTEPDAGQSGGAEWIPDNNPFPTAAGPTGKNPVYSYGHRNAQGLAWGYNNNSWKLYSSEHGDKSDDEVNIITQGSNYGWPKVAGMCDNNYNTFDANPDNNMLANQTVANEIAAFCNVTPNVQPMFSMFNVVGTSVPSSSLSNWDWPTVAPSSIEYYGNYDHAIPGWYRAVLVTSLKFGMFRLRLKPNGTEVDSSYTSSVTDTIPYLHGNRIRDMAINPHGDTLYFCIDNTGSTSGPTGGFTGGGSPTANGGMILRMVYLQTLPLSEEIPTRPVNNRTVVKVYPNPTSKILYVNGQRGLRHPLRAELYDITGKLLLQQIKDDDGFSINVEHFKPGMYIFKLYSGSGTLITTEKILVK